jgi:hypothetical protein
MDNIMKEKRITVGLPIDLYNLIKKMALLNNRTIIGQIKFMAKDYEVKT